MGKLLTTREAAMRLTDMNIVNGISDPISTGTVRTMISTGRLKARRVPGGIQLLVDEADLRKIRPRRSGRKPMIPVPVWDTIRHEILDLGQSVRLVAEAHRLDPVTIYRYLEREGINSPGSFIPDAEWEDVRRDLMEKKHAIEVVSMRYRYAVATIRAKVKAEQLTLPKHPGFEPLKRGPKPGHKKLEAKGANPPSKS